MEKEKGHFRYLLIMYIMLIPVIVSLFFLFRSDIKSNIEASGIIRHYAIWKEERSNTDSTYSVALYNNSNIILVNRTIPRKADNLHSAVEALLMTLSDDETAAGLVSFIPQGTKLIGISEEMGFFYVKLSSVFLSSPDINKATMQIKETLDNYYALESLTVICGSTIIAA